MSLKKEVNEILALIKNTNSQIAIATCNSSQKSNDL